MLQDGGVFTVCKGQIKVDADEKTVAAWGSGQLLLFSVSKRKKQAVYQFEARKWNGKSADDVIILDDGLDVTSWGYAYEHGWTQPLRVEVGSVDDEPPAGIAFVDFKKGAVRFPVQRRRSPRLVASSPIAHTAPSVFAVEDNILCVGGEEGMNLELWDISDIKNPKFINRMQPEVGPPVGMVLKGNIPPAKS